MESRAGEREETIGAKGELRGFRGFDLCTPGKLRRSSRRPISNIGNLSHYSLQKPERIALAGLR